MVLERDTQIYSEKYLRDNPDFGQIVFQAYQRLQVNFYNKFLEDCIFQHHWTQTLSLTDAHIFTLFWSHFLKGDIYYTTIETISEPYPDKDKESNNKILQDLPRPFFGEFWGGKGAGGDGSLFAKRPIVLEAPAMYYKDKKKILYNLKGGVTLEIGSTSASTTGFTLMQQKRLARFPYNHKKIGLFIFKDFIRKEDIIKEIKYTKKEIETLKGQGLWRDTPKI